MTQKRQIPPGFLTTTEVAAMLGCAPCTLKKFGVTALAIKLGTKFHLYREEDVRRFCKKVGATVAEKAIPPGWEHTGRVSPRHSELL